MNKAELRRHYKSIRNAVTEQKRKSELICERLVTSGVLEECKTVALYSNIGSEVHTDCIFDYLTKVGKTVCYPKVANSTAMIYYKVDSLTELVPDGAYNIAEPIDSCEQVEADKIDAVIMPGLCFDREMNRLGYGGGYYDRYFADCDRVLKIGICYDEQIFDDGIPTEENDIKVDFLITDAVFIKII